MLKKYQEQLIGGNWFIFGEHSDGSVDISNGTDDVFTKIPLKTAHNILKIREDFMTKIEDELESVKQ